MKACLTELSAEDSLARCSTMGVGRCVGGLKGSAVPRNPVHCCTGPVLLKVKGDLQIPQRMILRHVPDRGIMAFIRLTVVQSCVQVKSFPFF